MRTYSIFSGNPEYIVKYIPCVTWNIYLPAYGPLVKVKALYHFVF